MTSSARWGWVVALIASTGAALVLAFVLALSTEGGALEHQFVWLFWVNVAVATLLALVIGFTALRLVLRLRRGKFGSRLLIKLSGIFAVVGVLPGLVIYTVSYQFVARSIEAWFDVRVAGALDAGLALGRGTLETLTHELESKTRVAAERMSEVRGAVQALELERVREQLGALEVSLVSGSGQVLLTAGGGTAAVAPDRPPLRLLRQARATGSAGQIEGLDEDPAAAVGAARLRALARVPDSGIALSGDADRLLLIVQKLPATLVADALAVQSAYSQYQQRAIARDSLRRMYIGTLTLALVLAVFAAVLLAIVLGNQLARPLLLLADGVRQVAGGDLAPKPVFASRDELGGLTRSFADMTQQLADARAQVQRGVAQLEGARTRLQTILDNLTAGVIVFDRDGHLDSVNPGATRILRRPLSAWLGRRLGELPGLDDFALVVARRFEQLRESPEAGERDHWQDTFELALGTAGRDTLTLLVRGATLPHEARLVVFDDITEIVSAQRSVAWAEVARRLAHEIKNPLTPIQLSAERLQHRLEAKLDGADQALLVRSVATIVAQVQAMQRLVNEFRDYARLPSAQMKPLDLNALVSEVLALYGDAHDRGVLSASISEGLPPMLGDATQLRQVIHNLVQNALDAVADREGGHVEVQTAAVRGDEGELRALRLAVVDNGPGFPEQVLKRAFEPYVTTKPKGTGLGLAVVRKIADEHRARLRAANLHASEDDPESPVIGARVSLSFSSFAPQPADAAPAAPDGRAPAPGDATHQS